MPRKPVPDWLTVPEVATYFGCSASNIRQFVLQRKFPNMRKTGGGWLIPITDVKKFEEFRIKNGMRGGIEYEKRQSKKADKDRTAND